MTETKTSSVTAAEAPVDSPKLRTITADEEEQVVSGADLGAEHPDNMVALDDDAAEVVAPAPPADADEDLPGDDELDDLISDVDVDDVDQVGFDDSDITEPSEIDLTDESSVRGGR